MFLEEYQLDCGIKGSGKVIDILAKRQISLYCSWQQRRISLFLCSTKGPNRYRIGSSKLIVQLFYLIEKRYILLLMILAAIDLGSNAARLLISQAEPYEDGSVDFTKLNLVRIPLRLGFDVFNNGKIGDEKALQLIETMEAYKTLMKIYKVQSFRACATSAMRDAENGTALIDKIKEKTDIDIRIISGQEEASIVYETHIAEGLSGNKSYLYVDVGGGSTEITLFSKGKTFCKESFNIGTIRMLSGKVTDAHWEHMRRYIKENVRPHGPLEVIGSGGNINKVYSMAKRKDGKPLNIEVLRDYLKELSACSTAERMHRYKLRADRADVIVPAMEIYLSVMRWADAHEIFVPQIGLADGLIKMQYAALQR